MWMRAATLIVSVVLAGLAGPEPAGAAARADEKKHNLIGQHQCVSMRKPLQPPVAGYLIRDTAQPKRGLFYEPVDNLTAGRFVGMGGTWEMVYWCRR